jgi:FecR protein
MRRISFFCLTMGVLAGMAHYAHADQNIGSAAVAEKEVLRQLPGGSGRLGVGDQLFRDEVVHTGAESAAKLVFLDSTNLALGPTSRVVLDRFIYDPSRSSEGMAVKLAKGVFRFTTGVLQKDAYSITTPTAAIGVRGTVLDISVQGSRTRVTVVEGGALVCPIKKGITFAQQARACETHSSSCDCKTVGVGQTAQVSSSGGSAHASLFSSPVQFANFCSNASLCSSQDYASANPGQAPSAPSPTTPPPTGAVVAAPAAAIAAVIVTTIVVPIGIAAEHPPLSP